MIGKTYRYYNNNCIELSKLLNYTGNYNKLENGGNNMSDDRTEIMSVQEFRSKTMKPQLRPASWKWKDVQPKLMESLESSESGQGSVSLVHKDLEGAGAGVTPSLNVITQVFKPG